MTKKYQIFVSSTYNDLISERMKSVEAILSAGHIPAGMELFNACDINQKKLIKKWIDESDIYMLILGGRYGSIDPESGLSYTHWEYEYAKESGKPLFSLVLSDSYLNKKVKKGSLNAIDLEVSKPEYISFKATVLKNVVKFINSIEEVKGEVLSSIIQIEKSNTSLIGWVRSNEISIQEAEYSILINSVNIKDDLEYEKMREKVFTLNRILFPTSKNTPTRPVFEKKDEFRRKIIFVIKAPTLYFAEVRRKQFEDITKDFSFVVSCELGLFKSFKELEKL